MFYHFFSSGCTPNRTTNILANNQVNEISGNYGRMWLIYSLYLAFINAKHEQCHESSLGRHKQAFISPLRAIILCWWFFETTFGQTSQHFGGQENMEISYLEGEYGLLKIIHYSRSGPSLVPCPLSIECTGNCATHTYGIRLCGSVPSSAGCRYTATIIAG